MLQRRRRFGSILVLAAIAAGPGGCADCPILIAGDKLPLLTHEGHHANLATCEPALLESLRGAGLAEGRPPRWYDERRDHPPAVILGYEGGTVEHAVTHTYDRQAHNSSRIHDHFHMRTHTVTSTSRYR